MTTSQTTVQPAKTTRLIHAAMVTGVLLFALLVYFLLRPAQEISQDLPPIVPQVLLGVSLGACAVSLWFRRRVPQRSTDESADLFWTTATTPALLTWAFLEVASLTALVAWWLTGAALALPVAGVAILMFVVLNPARLERP